MRPALVCGCARYPFLSSSAMMLRMEAGERERFMRRHKLSDPTGSPVAMWSWMRSLRTSLERSSRVAAI